MCIRDSTHTHTHTNPLRLQKFVDTLTQLFREKAPDLMTKEFERDNVKLHATVMNAKFAAKHMESGASTNRDRGGEHSHMKKLFDATNVFKVSSIVLLTRPLPPQHWMCCTTSTSTAVLQGEWSGQRD